MPYNGSGTFTRLGNWVGDALANIKIRADRHDLNDDDLAAGLSKAICTDGQSIVTNNIPFNGHKLTNVANPVDAQDVVTRSFLDSFGGWTTSKYISGADAQGRLNFTSLTGANGITWSNIGAAWLARIGVTDRQRNRVVLNNNVDGSGTDVVSIDEADGVMSFPSQFVASTNLISDGVSWRTPSPGTGGLMAKSANNLSFLANFVATTLAYGVAALETWFSIGRNGGSVAVVLNKKASGDLVGIYGQMGGVARWLFQLGNGSAEDATQDGSFAYLTAYKNDGSLAFNVLWASRKDGKVRLPQGFGGAINFDNLITLSDPNGRIDAQGTWLTLGGGSSGVRLLPNGSGNTVGQAILDLTGMLSLSSYLKAFGIYERAGTGAAAGTQVFNWDYVDSTHINVYVGTTLVGTVTPACDYRIKRKVQPLPSTWEAVKALRPVSYSSADYQDLIVADDVDHWGFVAHELQEALVPTAASGVVDGPELQVPDHMTIIAALTAALQEALVRIEALEARA
jgi:hypothetical protein